MTVRPLHDRILVRRKEAETQTAGGIYLPGNTAEKPQQAEVLAVGPGARNDAGDFISLEIKVGDNVLFGKYSGTEIDVNGEECLILSEKDILAIIE